jgi:hypothetical protein
MQLDFPVVCRPFCFHQVEKAQKKSACEASNFTNAAPKATTPCFRNSYIIGYFKVTVKGKYKSRFAASARQRAFLYAQNAEV